MKRNRKYLALLFLITIMPLHFLCCGIITILILSILNYILHGDFIYDMHDIYMVCKLAPLGIIAGIGMWYLESRRLGIKIFGK